MKLAKYKSYLLGFFPLISGVTIGLLIVFRQNSLKNNSKAYIPPQEAENVPVIQVSSQNYPEQSLETYLFSSQSLLAKAIETSKNNAPGETEDSPGVSYNPERSRMGPGSPGVADSNPKNTPGESRPTPGVQERVDPTIKENNQRIIQLINEAINTINKAISNYPMDPRPWAQRARIYQTVKAYLPEAEKTALGDWQKATELDPTNIDYCQKVAQIYLSKNDYKSAVFYLQKASGANPADPNLLKELAKYQIRSGLLKQASVSYQRLLAILINQEQKDQVQKEIASLNQLLLQASSKTVNSEEQIPDKISLPDTPPLLEAHLIAENRPIIAAPNEVDDISQESELETNAYSGKTILPAGEIQVKVCNNHLTPETLVYLNPEGDLPGQVLIVKRKVPFDPESKGCSHFIAAIKTPLEKDLEFSWWVIEHGS